MSKVGGVYKITNLINGKYYIGSAVCFEKRWYMHVNQLKKGKHRNSHLQRAWDKYGDVFVFDILEVVNTHLLIEAEQKWLDTLWDSDECYNICKVASSRLGVVASTETRLKMSLARIGKKLSDQTRARMSAAKLGIKHKTPRSKEHCLAIGLVHKGKTVSKETRVKLKAARGKRPPASEETRRKMSESMKATLAARKVEMKNGALIRSES